MARIISIVVLVLVVLIGAWYVLSHQNFTSTLPSTAAPVVTSNASTSASLETAQQENLSTTTVASEIIGQWQSNDDPNYSIQVGGGGAWKDTYAGTSEAGTYDLFTSADPDPDFAGPLEPGVVYLKVAEGQSITYYDVLEANDSTLELTYLEQGETLMFSRAQ